MKSVPFLTGPGKNENIGDSEGEENATSRKGVFGDRRKRCPSGAFAEGKSDLRESIETRHATAPREQGDD